MLRRRAVVIGAFLFAFTLTGCATAAYGHGVDAASTGNPPAASPTPTADSAAREQAQRWLDAAALPPGAVRDDSTVATFTSYTGWPCGPFAELKGSWHIPGSTVSDAANFLRLHPPAGLITTAGAPISNDPAIDSATVGFIPKPDAQEGIVYTVQKTFDGVAVRAEVAALTTSATCAPLPSGGTWGPPGQG